MSNLAFARKSELKRANYVLMATTPEHKFNFARRTMQDYIRRFASSFSLIIIGNEYEPRNFYVMPYQAVSHLFTEDSLSVSSKSNARRWVGTIRGHMLQVNNAAPKVDVSSYYGRADLFEPTIEPTDPEHQNPLDDYAIENYPTEISARLKQSVFRRRVLTSYGSQCCLTETTETDLLVASHIVPWSARVESRLDPSNGLCLSTLYDALFDKGYFTFSDSMRVICRPRTVELSQYVRNALNAIDGHTAAAPLKHPPKPEFIRYHRDNVFVK